MDKIRTFTCTNCGATIATSAAPGTQIDCQYCGTSNQVPDEAVGTDAPAATLTAPATADETVVRRGLPGELPKGPEHDKPLEERLAPQPGSPADVGYTVDSDAGRPQVERGPVEASPEGSPEVEPAYLEGTAAGELHPLPTASGREPDVAEMIAEPTKYGVGIPSTEGEPVVTGPGTVKVTPPQLPQAGGPPGAAMGRPNRAPMIIAGVVIGLCCLGAAMLACVWAVLVPIMSSGR